VLYKLDDLVRPYCHKILVVIEPLLIDEDYYARVEVRVCVCVLVFVCVCMVCVCECGCVLTVCVCVCVCRGVRLSPIFPKRQVSPR